MIQKVRCDIKIEEKKTEFYSFIGDNATLTGELLILLN